MGKILRSIDSLPSEAFIIMPTLTEEENEINKRRVNEVAVTCAKQIIKEFNEQKEYGVKEWDEYFDRTPINPNAYLVEVTEEEMDRIIYGQAI